MYKYTLPNGAEINMDSIVDAVLAEDDYPQVYLDIETGALIEIPNKDSLKHWVKEIGQSKRYFLIEYLNDFDRNEIAKDFIKLFSADIGSKDVLLAKKSLASGGWRDFENFLRTETDGFIHAWDQFIHDEAWECANEWLTNHPEVDIKTEFEGCGNCAICELMRKGEDGDPQKLMEAFKTENIMQQVSEQMNDFTNSKKMVLSKKAENKNVGDKIYVFKVSLNNSSPKIWRRIAVPKEYTFFDLHCAIQDVVGWTDSHLHDFSLDTRSQSKSKRSGMGKMIKIEFPNPEDDDWGGFMGSEKSEKMDERAEYISEWFPEKMKQCTYTYDFGDNWDHTVLFEKELDRDPKAKYPQCLSGKNTCPPEECGSVWGYEDLQKILKNPKHKEHKNMLNWLGIDSPEEFDPTNFNPSEVEFEDPGDVLKRYEEGFGIEPLAK
jgi:hypothetical protein